MKAVQRSWAEGSATALRFMGTSRVAAATARLMSNGKVGSISSGARDHHRAASFRAAVATDVAGKVSRPMSTAVGPAGAGAGAEGAPNQKEVLPGDFK